MPGKYAVGCGVSEPLFHKISQDASRRGISRSSMIREVLAHVYAECESECEACEWEASTGEQPYYYREEE